MATFKIKAQNGKKRTVFFSGKHVAIDYAAARPGKRSGTAPLHIDEHGSYYAPIEEGWFQVRFRPDTRVWKVVS